MKLHHTVLLTLAACAAVSVAAAEDVTWNYDTDATINFTEGSMPNIPTEGSISKTGTGTVTLDLGKNGATGAECDATASTFAGNVIIEAGTIKIGDADGGTGQAWRVSNNVLGSEGTIFVKKGASLHLQITQHGSADINKAISLEGGTLAIGDGNYTFNKALTLTADSTINNVWNKNHTFNSINAEGKTLKFTQGNGQSSTQTFKGNVNVGKIVGGEKMKLVFNKDGNALTGLTTNGIELGNNGSMDLHVTQNGTTSLGAVVLKGNNTIHMIDGHYTATSLTLEGDATINSDWNKTFKAEKLNAADKALTFFG